MSNYNWCHGPECHTQQTQSSIRGSGRDKVLRTRRIKVYQPQTPHIYDFFCNNRCLHDFLRLHATAIANIAPRREALETPIKVEKEKYESYKYDYNYNNQNGTYESPRRVPYQATRTTIKSVDNNGG